MQPTELLNSLGLAEYIQTFEDNAIDTESLVSLSDADLKELGVAKLGHRKKILEAIASFSPAPVSQPVDAIADMAAQLPGAATPSGYDFSETALVISRPGAPLLGLAAGGARRGHCLYFGCGFTRVNHVLDPSLQPAHGNSHGVRVRRFDLDLRGRHLAG